MDAVKFFFQTQLPAYLKSLPIPSTFEGFTALSGNDWVRLFPLIGFVLILIFIFISNILEFGRSAKEGTEGKGSSKALVNPSIDKEKDKIATAVDMEDLGDKTVYCRCWRSKKFPLCDGSHNAHNKDTGDNVGPLIVKRQQAEKKAA